MHTEKLGDLVMNIYKNLKTKIERDLKHYGTNADIDDFF